MSEIIPATGITLLYVNDDPTSGVIRGYDGEIANNQQTLVIPEGVTAIANLAFSGKSDMGRVQLPSTLISIGNNAFAGCSRLLSITIPSSVTYIGTSAFYGCSSLATITINSAITAIQDTTFWGCPIQTITIPNTVTTIGYAAFYQCTSLTSLIIPASVTSIGDSAFEECHNLSSLTFYGDVPTFNFYMTQWNGVRYNYLNTTVQINHLSYKNGWNSIPEPWVNNRSPIVGTNPVLSPTDPTVLIGHIGTPTNGGVLLIPAGVTTIAASAFANRPDITGIDWGSSAVTTIRAGAFYNCPNIGSGFTLPETLTTLEEGAFGATGITGLTLPASVTDLGQISIANSPAITGLNMSASVATTIPAGWFSSATQLTTLYIPNTTTTLPASIFTPLSALTAIDMTDVSGLTAIPASAFAGLTNLSSVTLPPNLTAIGAQAFQGCTGLLTIALPIGPIAIGEEVFDGCSALTTVTGLNLSDLGANAFRGTAVTSATFGASDLLGLSLKGWSSLTNLVLTDVNATFIPGGFLNDVSATLVGLTLPNAITTLANSGIRSLTALTYLTMTGCTQLTFIGTEAFKDMTSLASVSLPPTITEIRARAFQGCTGLGPSSVTLPDSVTSIGDYAFAGCTGITDSSLMNLAPLTAIGAHAFEGTGISGTLNLPNSITTIGEAAFKGLTGITSVAWPGVVVTIGASAFEGCSGINGSFIFPTSLVTIGASAFKGCSQMGAPTFPESLTTIGAGAFEGCIGMATLYFTNHTSAQLAIIGDRAFFGCTGLATGMDFPTSLVTIGASAFEGCTTSTVGSFSNFNSLQKLATIGAAAFKGTTILSPTITIPQSVTTIGAEAFANAGLTSVTIGVSSDVSGNIIPRILGASVFASNTGLTTANLIGVTNTVMPTGTFAGCTSLATVTLPNALTAFSWADVLAGTAVTSLTLPNSITDLANVSLAGAESALTSLDLSYLESVVSIPADFVSGFSQLDSISLRVSVNAPLTSIGANAFKGTAISTLVVPASLATIGAGAFEGCSSLITLDLSATAITHLDGSSFAGCSALGSGLVLPAGLATFGAGLFQNIGATQVVLPATIAALPAGAFEDFTSLTLVDLSACTSMVAIPANAFKGASQLATVRLPEGVESIGDHAFESCPNLTTIVLPSTVKTIGVAAFILSGLTAITLPSGLQSIGEEAFMGLSQISVALTLPAALTSVGIRAFSGCSGIISLDASAATALNGIPEETFKGCTGMTSVILPATMPSGAVFGARAFEGCNNTALASVTVDVPSGVVTIEAACFSSVGFGTLTLPNSVTTIGADAFGNTLSSMITAIPNALISIGDSAFKGFTGITSATFVAGLTLLGEEAFSGTSLTAADMGACTGLTTLSHRAFKGCPLDSVVLPPALVNIGDEAFANCPLTNSPTPTFPATLTTIGEGAFSGVTGLTSVTLPAAMETILNEAFKGCTGLITVVIHGAVTSFGDSVFAGCTALTSANLAAMNIDYLSRLTFTGCTSLTTVLLPYALTGAINKDTFAGAPITALTLPAGITELSLTQQGEAAFIGLTSLAYLDMSGCAGLTVIPDSAFSGCTSLVTVKLPPSLATISTDAFYGNVFSAIQIPSTVTAIGDYAFYGNTALASITLPCAIAEGNFGTHVFDGCTALQSANLGALQIETLPESTFTGCAALTSVTLPSGLAYLNWAPFGDTAVTTLVAPASVVALPLRADSTGAFQGIATLTAIDLSGCTGLTEIPGYAFSGCTALASFGMPPNIQSIGEYAFYQTSLTGVFTIPAAVLSVGNNAFSEMDISSAVFTGPTDIAGTSVFNGCTSLTAVDMGSVVSTSLDADIFAGCTALSSIVFPHDLASINGGLIRDTVVTRLTLPAGLTEIGMNSFNSSVGFLGSQTLEYVDMSGCTALSQIPGNAFYGCTSLTHVILPVGGVLEVIGSNAFAECSAIANAIVFPSGLLTIDTSAFSNCSQLPSVTIPASVTSIGVQAFYGCAALTSVVVPGEVSVMGDGVFMNCPELVSVDIGNASVTSLGSSSFSGCTKLASVVLPKGLTSINKAPFEGTAVTTIDLRRCTSMVYLESSAFANATWLSSILLPKTITEINASAFIGCTGMTSILLPSSLQRIYSEAFGAMTGLTSVIIPANVTYIDINVFTGSGLTSATFLGNMPSFGYGGIHNTFPTPCTIYYPLSASEWPADGTIQDGITYVAVSNPASALITNAATPAAFAEALFMLSGEISVSGFNLGAVVSTVASGVDLSNKDVTIFAVAAGATINLPSSVTTQAALYFPGAVGTTYNLVMPHDSSIVLPVTILANGIRIDDVTYARGSTVTLGAQQFLVAANGSGVLVKTADVLIPSAWVQSGATLVGTELSVSNVVSITPDGTFVAVGSPGENTVRIYSLGADVSGSPVWVPVGNAIVAQTGNFGTSVKILNSTPLDTIVAIGNSSDTALGGTIHVYRYNLGGDWTLIGSPICGADYSATGLGWTLALSGAGAATVRVAAYDTGNATVRIFEWNGGAWQLLGNPINGPFGSQFGQSIAISYDGSIVAIGAPNMDNQTGAVSVYAWDGTAWDVRGDLMTGDAQNEQFGFSIALNYTGNILVIGAPYGNYVRSYIWNAAAQAWVQHGQDISGANIGTSLAMSQSGEKLLIGATNIGYGSVQSYVWRIDDWFAYGPALSSTTEMFGATLATTASANRIVIGSNTNDMGGSVRIYDWREYPLELMMEATNATTSSVTIVVTSRPLPSDLVLISGEGTFTYNDASGIAVISNLQYDTPYTFTFNTRDLAYSGVVATVPATTANIPKTHNWAQVGTVISGGGGESLGTTMATSANGEIIAVGAPNANSSTGYVRVFQKSGAFWNYLGSDIMGQTGGEQFGSSISLSDDGMTLAVGAPLANDAASEYGPTGTVRVYSWDAGTTSWILKGNPIYEADIAVTSMGSSVSLSSNGTVLAIGDTQWNSGTGRVRIYDWNESATLWVQRGDAIPGEVVSNFFGTSCSLSANGSIVAIGATDNTNASGIFAGHVRVYAWVGGAWVKRGADINGEAAGDYSGKSVSLSAAGTVLAIGAPQNAGGGVNAGQARVYTWNDASGVWIQRGTDINGVAGSFLGWSVALSDDGLVLAAGAPYSDPNTPGEGSVRVYDWTGSMWLLRQPAFTGAAVSSRAGQCVALSADGSILAYSAPNESNASGAVRAYKWLPIASLAMNFVSKTATTVTYAVTSWTPSTLTLVDSPYMLSYDQGTAQATVSGLIPDVTYRFTFNTTDTLYDGVALTVPVVRTSASTPQKIWIKRGADINGELYGDRSGYSVSLSANGSVVAIGAPFNDGNGEDSGHVRIYELVDGVWTPRGADIDGEALGDQSGWSVSLSADGSIVAIGAITNSGNGAWAGQVRVYEWANGAWTKRGADIDGEALGDQSGWSVSLSADGTVVAIGAANNSGNGAWAGHVRVYQWANGAWAKRGADIDGEAEYDYSGYSVSLSADGSVVAIGAINNSGGAGQVRVYEWANGVWTKRGADFDGDYNGVQSGYAVSLSADGSIVAFGAIFGGPAVPGQVRVYKWANGAWTQRGNDINGDFTYENFGYSVSLSANGDAIAVGTGGNPSGPVRIFDYADNGWTLRNGTIYSESPGDYAGMSVSLSADGSTVAIGARLNSNIGEYAGTTRVYTEQTLPVLSLSLNSVGIARASYTVTSTPLPVSLVLADLSGSLTYDAATGVALITGLTGGTSYTFGFNTTDTAYDNSTSIYMPSITTKNAISVPPWNQRGEDLLGEAEYDQSGRSVSLSADGTVVAIGATYNDSNGTDAGHVRVYEWANGAWAQRGADIDGEAVEDQSGRSVSLSADGSVVAIGAAYNSGNGTVAGQVRVYEWANGAWAQRGADIDGEAEYDQSGRSVSLSADGTVVAIGAAYNDSNGTDAGHVRVYEWANGAWAQRGADIDGEAESNYSGWSVSLSADGTVVAIGAANNSGNGTYAGHVRVYQWANGAWTQRGADIDGEAEYDWSGWSVSLSADGSVVAIGASRNSDSGTEAGHVRVYQWANGAWTKRGADIDGEAEYDWSGYSVSLSADGSVVAIGAPFNNGNGSFAGQVRVYRWIMGSWSQIGGDIDGDTAYAIAGTSVSLSADGYTVAVGAPSDDVGLPGMVRVFNRAAPAQLALSYVSKTSTSVTYTVTSMPRPTTLTKTVGDGTLTYDVSSGVATISGLAASTAYTFAFNTVDAMYNGVEVTTATVTTTTASGISLIPLTLSYASKTSTSVTYTVTSTPLPATLTKTAGAGTLAYDISSGAAVISGLTANTQYQFSFTTSDPAYEGTTVQMVPVTTDNVSEAGGGGGLSTPVTFNVTSVSASSTANSLTFQSNANRGIYPTTVSTTLPMGASQAYDASSGIIVISGLAPSTGYDFTFFTTDNRFSGTVSISALTLADEGGSGGGDNSQQLTLVFVSKTTTSLTYRVTNVPLPTDLLADGSPISMAEDGTIVLSGLQPNTIPFILISTTDPTFSISEYMVDEATLAADGATLSLTYVSKTATSVTYTVSTPYPADLTYMGPNTLATFEYYGLTGEVIFSELEPGTTYTEFIIETNDQAYSVKSYTAPSVTTLQGTLTVSASPTATTSSSLTYQISAVGGVFPSSVSVAGKTASYNAASGVIVVSGLSASTSHTLVFSTSDQRFTGTASRTASTSAAPVEPESIPCFLGSARVRMADGSWCRLRDLAVGDAVDGGKVVRVARKTVTASSAVNPYVIRAGQWGARRRLLISPNHRVAIPGRGMVEAKDLGLAQQAMEGAFDYYNVEITGNGNMNVEGVEVESLAPVRRVVVTMDEFAALLKAKYAGRSVEEIEQLVKATCRMLPGGRVEVPVMRR